MGKLLLFSLMKRPETGHSDTDGDAELVMFTGVRYERQKSDEENKPPDVKPPPQRESGG
jgi:hypothetical protein